MHLSGVLAVAVAWLVIGVAGVCAIGKKGLVPKILLPAGSVFGIALFGIALHALFAPAEAAIVPIGLPGLPFHFRVDSLSAFFLLVIGGAAAGVSAYAAGYFRRIDGEIPPGLIGLQYHVFLASMVLVVVADDAYAFMVMWETMALSSFFLVIAEHRVADNRRAGYLYLLIAHIGAIGILLCFGVLQANTGDYTFANMRLQQHAPFWASVAFLLALFGFGAKAGVIPLHVWLPEAHPAAPSPVSALMSGVMLKTAVYGFLRVSFDLLHVQLWWWGVLLLGIGLVTGLFGVVFAAVQVDMKRLLAYSSIENIGLIFAAIGLAVVFSAFGMTPMAALAMTAALYHVVSHAFFKSLLFASTGAVLHATSQRSLGKLGGLIRYMPWVAWICLIGVLASAGLPPLSGFISEWLLLQGFLFTPELPSSFLNMLIPIAAALVALIAALAGYTMVKFFGIIFLGQPREETLAQVHDAGHWERAGMIWLACGCVLLGLLPVQFIQIIDSVTRQLAGAGLRDTVSQSSWLLIPVAAERASYGPIIVLAGVAASVALAVLLVRRFYHGRLRRAAPWDCGFPWLTPRMQDTAEGFGQPIRQIFETLFRIERHLPTPFDAQPHYRVSIGDHFWYWLYLPLAYLTERMARLIGLLQRGRISVYLLYSFVTLIGILVWVTR